MKKTLASLAILALLAGCTIFKTVSRYTPDPANTQILKDTVAASVNVGSFTDASYRKELTCMSLAIIEAPDNWTYADAIRFALIDELTQAGRFDPEAPVTLTAHLNRIDVDTDKGEWIINLTLASTNGKKLTVEEIHRYTPISIAGEVNCTRAAANYPDVLSAFMKKLIASPDFAALTEDTPPEAKKPATPVLTPEQEKAAEEKARETGTERIRRMDSLDSRKGAL